VAAWDSLTGSTTPDRWPSIRGQPNGLADIRTGANPAVVGDKRGGRNRGGGQSGGRAENRDDQSGGPCGDQKPALSERAYRLREFQASATALPLLGWWR
jgi:hypothetical protein